MTEKTTQPERGWLAIFVAAAVLLGSLALPTLTEAPKPSTITVTVTDLDNDSSPQTYHAAVVKTSADAPAQQVAAPVDPWRDAIDRQLEQYREQEHERIRSQHREWLRSLEQAR